MPQLRVALAQIDVTVGDLAGNADCVVRETERAAAGGAHLVAFPEMALTGYPPEDLVLRSSFVKRLTAVMMSMAFCVSRNSRMLERTSSYGCVPAGRLSSIEGTPEAPVVPKATKPKAKKKAAT